LYYDSFFDSGKKIMDFCKILSTNQIIIPNVSLDAAGQTTRLKAELSAKREATARYHYNIIT